MTKLNLNNEILRLAKKYYHSDSSPILTERDLAKLSPRQLNNLTNWATNTNPEKKAKIQGRKYTGKTYNQLKKIF